MTSRRSEIAMTLPEIQAYLGRQRKVIIASNGVGGFPHPVPMNFVYRDDRFLMTTFRKSQKVRNIERDPRVALLVESGEAYHELQSVLAYARAEIIDDFDETLSVLLAIAGTAGEAVQGGFDPSEVARATALKRVVISCRPDEFVSWDHSKLKGRY